MAALNKKIFLDFVVTTTKHRPCRRYSRNNQWHVIFQRRHPASVSPSFRERNNGRAVSLETLSKSTIYKRSDTILKYTMYNDKYFLEITTVKLA